MKKWALAVTAFMVIAVTCLYVVIPGRVIVSNVATVKAPEAAVVRLLLSKEGWEHWWPSATTQNNVFSYRNLDFHAFKFTNSYVATTVTRNNFAARSILYFNATDQNTTLLRWTIDHKLSLNPVNRIKDYIQLRNIDASVKKVLAHFQKFTDKKANVYGIDIEYSKVKDTVVSLINITFGRYPSTDEIYTLINCLRQYNMRKGIDKGSHPMVNVTRLSSSEYGVMVAVPVKRRADNHKQIKFKALVPGNILTARVKGGTATVDHAMSQMTNYVTDMRHVSPAIPFQKFITNRVAEPDTSNWITELYYPIL